MDSRRGRDRPISMMVYEMKYDSPFDIMKKKAEDRKGGRRE